MESKLLELRILDYQQRIELIDEQIEKIKKLKEKVVEDMNLVDAPANAPAMLATGGGGGVMVRAMARAKARKLAQTSAATPPPPPPNSPKNHETDQ